MEQLENAYDTVPAADLFSYSLVEFIVSEFGQSQLNRILRAPALLEEILGIQLNHLEQQWIDFMHNSYSSE